MFPFKFDIEYKLILAATAAVGVLYLLSRDAIKQTAIVAEKAVDVLGDAITAADPLNEENVFFDYTTRFYQAVTGSDQTPGADVYDLFNPGAP